MRVALFTNNYLPFCGGVTVSVETLRRGLESFGHEPWVFAPRFPNGHVDGDRIVRYPSMPALAHPDFVLAIPYSPRVSRMVHALDFDVFHAHHPFLLGPTARRLSRRLGRPLVFTHHTRYEKYAHYVPLPQSMVVAGAVQLSTRFAQKADAVIAPSIVIRDELRARGVTTPIHVVPTGIDLESFQPGDRLAARRMLKLPEDGKIVMYVGRLDREKTVDRVLECFARVAPQCPDTRLALVGHGTERARLEALAATLGIGARTVFLGLIPHDDVAIAYQAGDVFLFTSETETQGLVLAEAAACGIPAVAVRGSGSNEVVRDGETGLLTAPDAGALAAALRLLLTDEARWQRMSAHARKVAIAEFGTDAQMHGTLRVYVDAAERLRHARAPS